MPASDPALPGPFALLRCRSCGTARTAGDPPPEGHEVGAYRPGAPRLARAAAPVLSLFDRHRLALLRRHVPAPAALLDAGAGRGRFVAAARRAGYSAVGVEPSRRGVEGARALGVDLVAAGLDDAPIAAGSLDAVTLWHVLEHVEEPGAALERAAAWLRPGGVLLVGVPNLGSLQARLGGDRWYHLDVPRHRTHFTVAGLHALLRARGLRPRSTHHLLLEHNPFGMWQSLASRLTRTPSFLYHLLKRNAPPDRRDLAVTVGLLPLAPAAALVEAAAGLVGRGGTVALVARREGASSG